MNEYVCAAGELARVSRMPILVVNDAYGIRSGDHLSYNVYHLLGESLFKHMKPGYNYTSYRTLLFFFMHSYT